MISPAWRTQILVLKRRVAVARRPRGAHGHDANAAFSVIL